MKILNLDKIAPQSTRTIVLGDTSHPILPMTVENFVLTSRRVEELNAADATYSEQIKSTIDMILRSVPSIPETDLMKRSLEELNTIAAFVRGEDVDGQEDEPGN